MVFATIGVALWASSRSIPTTSVRPAEVVIAQVPWQLEVYPAGASDVPHAPRVIARQRKPLADLIETLYSAMFLEPENLDDVVGASFSTRAGRAFLRTSRALEIESGTTQIIRRAARVGVDGRSGRFAAARVHVVANRLPDRGRVAHRATLWLARTSDSWKVIGFEVDQGPARR